MFLAQSPLYACDDKRNRERLFYGFMKVKVTSNIILDTLFILAFSVGYASLLKFVTYAILPIPETIQLFLFLSLLYIIRFKGSNVKKRNYFGGRLLYILIILYIWEVLQGIMMGAELSFILVIVVNLLSSLVAFKYINNIINEVSCIDPVLKSYSIYMYYTLFVVLFSSILILSGVLSPYSNPLGTNSLFATNMESDGITYFFPGCLSVTYSGSSPFLSFLNFPSLSGLSHESQAMYITIYPALFLLFYRDSANKHLERNILLLFIVTTVLTTSLTAVICFLLTYSLHLFWRFRDKSQAGSVVIIIFFAFLICLFVANSQFGGIINDFVLAKANFDTVGSSGSYSLSLIDYIFSPSGLIGSGILGSTSEMALQKETLNCGLVSSILIVTFYLFFIYTCFKNILSRKLLCHSIGLAAFYFIAHSFKYGIQVFNNNYLFFMVFLLCYAELYRRGKIQTTDKVESAKTHVALS